MVKARIIEELENPFSTGEDFASMFEQTDVIKLEEGTIVGGRILSIDPKI